MTTIDETDRIDIGHFCGEHVWIRNEVKGFKPRVEKIEASMESKADKADIKEVWVGVNNVRGMFYATLVSIVGSTVVIIGALSMIIWNIVSQKVGL